MENLKLEINQRVEILWGEHIYLSNVQDEVDGKAVLSIPVYNCEYLTLKEGEMVDAVYYDKNHGVFGFVITIEGRRVENNIPCYLVSKPFNVKKIQRRDFVRVDILDMVKYTIISKDTDSKFEKAFILDLSGGGFRLKTKREIKLGVIIDSEIKVDDDIINVKGEIVRKEKSIDKEFIYGVSFIGIDDCIREKVIRSVFLIMRKQRELS